MTTYSDFMVNLHKRLVEERGVTDSTATQYLQSLFKLNDSKPFKNMSWTRNYEAVNKIIDSYAKNTQSGMYGALTSALTLFKDSPIYKKTHAYYRDRMLELRDEREQQAPNTKTEKQEQSWVDWDAVLKRRDALREEVNGFVNNKKLTSAQYEMLLDYVVASLYTDFVPRRNQDYFYMYVVKKLPKEYSKEQNYYDISTNKFIFNKYKTSRSYGEQRFDVPDMLQETLKQFIKHHPLKKNKEFKLLVKQDGSNFTTENAITRILNRVFGSKVGSSQLRHSFVSSKYGGSLKEQRQDALQMGHTVEEQNKTYIKF